MRLEDYDYQLPCDRIARHPTQRRDESRLLVVERSSGRLCHGLFRDIGEFLRPGDLLVLNDSRVIAARLYARRHPGGGRVEVFLVNEVELLVWRAMVRPGKKIKKGEQLIVEHKGCATTDSVRAGRDQAALTSSFTALVVGYAGRGERIVRFDLSGCEWREFLEQCGHTPLPPYILKARKMASEPPCDTDDDRERYQTVYAATPGSVAAPTAGLHFTKELLAELGAKGIEFARVTLHVGPGTFQPLLSDHLAAGQLHEEFYSVDAATAEQVNRARRDGRRIIPVGTTSVRVLESACDSRGRLDAQSGTTRLLIAPGFQFRLADVLITNFHLPRSSLLLLVCAFAGRETILRAYEEAIAQGYRFYSYGDAMMIL
ncbi:tRNA preQ1(34) S-adenosylmethionine ribosyltransferase-isomerase QueA [Candidatus Sumerlaeota bacterium]|nr:tRNA preQ1(34) S-adenosylmethionine ribosyltransferase-isomerase QueA [Candidatus Sumerlaeota bacterium]